MDIDPGVVTDLGWDYGLMGEVDHRKVKAPYIRLVSIISADNIKTGVFDLRFPFYFEMEWNSINKFD